MMRRIVRDSRVLVIGAACVVLAATATAGAATAGGADDPVAGAAVKPKNGKYTGKVGSFSRISFKVDGRRVKKLAAGVNAACQDTFGTITRFTELAIKLGKGKSRIKKNGTFKGSGEDENGTAWKVKGKFTSRKRARGTFEASAFVFGGIPPFFSSELCSGSEKWKAKR
jgi:hypothetical protein